MAPESGVPKPESPEAGATKHCRGIYMNKIKNFQNNSLRNGSQVSKYSMCFLWPGVVSTGRGPGDEGTGLQRTFIQHHLAHYPSQHPGVLVWQVTIEILQSFVSTHIFCLTKIGRNSRASKPAITHTKVFPTIQANIDSIWVSLWKCKNAYLQIIGRTG